MRWRRPARELVRVGAVAALGIGDAHEPDQLECPLARLRCALPEPDVRGLRDLLAHAHDRIQRCHRLLEDHADVVSAQLRERLRGERLAVEHDLAAGDLRPAWQQAHDRAQRHALSAAGLADEAQRPSARDVQADAVDRLDDAARRRDLDAQVAQRENRLGRRHSGASRSARPSPSSERPSPVSRMAMPGNVDNCHCVVISDSPSAIIDPQSAAGGGMPAPR